MSAKLFINKILFPIITVGIEEEEVLLREVHQKLREIHLLFMDSFEETAEKNLNYCKEYRKYCL